MQVLTVNIHKGYDVFNTRFVLHELREAVRAMGSDVVFLQEVQGGSGPSAAQYEFLADQIWSEHAYGRNAVAEGQDPLPPKARQPVAVALLMPCSALMRCHSERCYC